MLLILGWWVPWEANAVLVGIILVSGLGEFRTWRG